MHHNEVYRSYMEIFFEFLTFQSWECVDQHIRLR